MAERGILGKRALDKMFYAYHRAEANLRAERNKRFPAGTRVICDFPFPRSTATVQEGSLYADQVLTDRGHMGWHHLEKVDDAQPSTDAGEI